MHLCKTRFFTLKTSISGLESLLISYEMSKQNLKTQNIWRNLKAMDLLLLLSLLIQHKFYRYQLLSLLLRMFQVLKLKEFLMKLLPADTIFLNLLWTTQVGFYQALYELLSLFLNRIISPRWLTQQMKTLIHTLKNGFE